MSFRRLHTVSGHLLPGSASSEPLYSVDDDSYEAYGRVWHVKQLRNSRTGEFVEVLLNTPFGLNRSSGSGSVNGLVLRSKVSRELRVVQPHRTGHKGGLMVPFANRVRDGRYTFGERVHQLNCNWNERERRMTRSGRHAIHGLLPNDMKVASVVVTEHGAALTLSHIFDGSDPGYPFKLELRVTYTLDAAGFAIRVEARNAMSVDPCPFMVGWHPWFCVSDVGDAIVAFDSRSGFNRSEHPEHPERDSIPTGSACRSEDFTRGAPLGTAFWDDGFKALGSITAVPKLKTRIVDGKSKDVAVLWQEAQCRFIQIYTGEREAGVVAVEPMSGCTNCFNNGDGLVVLQAGEEWETSFGVYLE